VARLKLSFATRINERVRPLVDGTVRPDGIDLVPTIAHPGETFWRQLRFGDFDISEMSLSSFLIAKSRGSDLVAIPAFPSRRFFHIELDARADAGIDRPAALTGKRIGVPEYQMSAAMWARGMLQDLYGVRPQDMRWRQGGLEQTGRKDKFPLNLPTGFPLEALAPGDTLNAALAEGRIDALFSAQLGDDFDLEQNSAILKDEDRCIRCALCVARCPADAISMERVSFRTEWRNP